MTSEPSDLDDDIPEPDDVPDSDLADIEDDLEIDDDIDADIDADIDDEIEDDPIVAADTAIDDDAGDDTADDEENLDALEAEELEMLTEDEISESIAVDEAAELRSLLREEREMDIDPEQAGSDEFVCQSCFLLKRRSQLADRRKKYCRDCVG